MAVPAMQLSHDPSAVHIAIASSGVQQRLRLKQALELNGLRVVLSEPLSPLFLTKLAQRDADVLIVDIDEEHGRQAELIEQLLEDAEIPILFNDVSAFAAGDVLVDAKWYRKLLGKIAELTGRPDIHSAAAHASLAEFGDIGSAASRRPRTVAAAGLATNVWVLGASLGGPQALSRFLSALEPSLPVAFIVAQHLGANLISLLAKQLERVSPFEVLTPHIGHVLRHGQILIAPVDERLTINPIGAIELQPYHEPTRYSPSIDLVSSDMAQRYRHNSGAIIFSGLGDDGVLGCRAVLEHGGSVWAQRSETCIASSMPDHVTRAALASYTDTPEGLAESLSQRLGASQVTGS